MFGIRLPYNFNSPYKATSIIDFWRRWHITLSNWLRDYLYIPLGGSRHGPARRYVNLVATMLLGGLWHGAAWSFVVWGLLHGLYLMINHGWRALPGRTASRLLPAPAAWLLTFAAVAVAWVFFRSPTFGHALAMVEGLAGMKGLHSDALAPVFGAGKALVLGVALIVALLMPNTQQLIDRPKASDAAADGAGSHWRLRWQPTLVWSAVLAALFLVSFTQMSTRREFVYFQF
jgi:D-alanyl-lipoteichoic acid acyltransferase DltB (MBOAT superfamily)